MSLGFLFLLDVSGGMQRGHILCRAGGRVADLTIFRIHHYSYVFCLLLVGGIEPKSGTE